VNQSGWWSRARKDRDMSEHVVKVDESNFQQVVIDGSQHAPVIVDFWAPWCAPCRALAPVLEKLAAEYGGRFTLAKVNSDENQKLAGSLGVRGIPNVKVFVDGVIVDEFSGALPERMVREFIDRAVPSRAEELRREAMVAYARGDGERALALLSEAAAADPKNENVRLDTIEILIDAGKTDEAGTMFDLLAPLTRMEERAKTLAAKLQFASAGTGAVSLDALKTRIAKNADDLEARLQLANASVAQQDYPSALEQLLEIVRRDRSFQDDAGRKTMLQLFTLLGNSGDLVGEYRRKLASAMY
jgi:putative thioredoxin